MSGTYVFDTAGSGYGNALYVLTRLPGARSWRARRTRPRGRRGAPVVKLSLEQGQTVLVVVDGMASTVAGTPIRYTLHIREYGPRETGRCANGADNDADGRADDADSDCR